MIDLSQIKYEMNGLGEQLEELSRQIGVAAIAGRLSELTGQSERQEF